MKQLVNAPLKVIGFQVQSWVSRPGQLTPWSWSLSPGAQPAACASVGSSQALGLHAGTSTDTCVPRPHDRSATQIGSPFSLHCPWLRVSTSCPSPSLSSWAPKCLNPGFPHMTSLPHLSSAPASCLPKQGHLWPHPPDPASQRAWHSARWGGLLPVRLFFTGLQL